MDKRELQILSNVMNNEYGLKFIFILLNHLGAFDYSINRNLTDRDVFMHIGKREKGCWLLDCCYKANPNKFMELLAQQKKEN